MKQVTDKFLTKMEDTLRTYIPRLSIDGVEIDGDLQAGMTIALGSCGSEEFYIGNMFIPSISASIAECTTKLQDKELLLEMGLIMNDGEVEYIPVGYFTVEKPYTKKDVTTFTAYGRLMSKGGILYSSSLNYPTTLQTVIDEIAETMGISIVLNGLSADGTINTPIKGELCRDALKYVAGLLGGFVTEDSAGNGVISKYTLNRALVIDTDLCYEYPESNDDIYTVTGIEVIVKEEGSEEDGTTVEGEKYASNMDINVVTLNPYMNQSLFESCEANIVGFSYLPSTVRFLGDIRLEPWDSIVIIDDEEAIDVPCMNISHVWDGGLVTTITAPGATAAESDGAFKGSMSKMVEKTYLKTLVLEQLIAQKIDAEYIRTNYLEATDLHISGNSSFEGAITCKDDLTISYENGESSAVLSVEDRSVVWADMSYDGNVIANTSSASIAPCFVIDVDHGLDVTGPVKADYLEARRFYGLKGAFGSIITRSLVSETIETTGNIYLNKNADGIFTGGKTTYGEGVEGVHIRKNGRIYMEGGSVTPGLYFYHGGQTSNGANIVYDSTDDYLKFNGATRYTFGNRVDVSGNVLITGHYYTNGKTSSSDGKTGAVLAATGRLFLTGGEGTDYQNPYICFYKKGSTTDDAYISYQAATDYLAFGGATRYTFDTNVYGAGGLWATGGVGSGGKTRTDDGQTGVMMISSGSIHIQKTDGNPYIGFYGEGQTGYGTSISYDKANDYLKFNGAAHYEFSSGIYGPALYLTGSIRIGEDDTSSNMEGRGLNITWKDNTTHYIVYRADDGLTAYFGWAGSSSYASVGVLRGRTVKYSNSSGTTTLSDERLKKDFTSLDEWDSFFDSIEPCAFRMKGGNSGRFHIGFKAKQIEQALLDCGKSTKDFAGFVRMAYQPDSDDPEGRAIYEAAGIKAGDDEYGLVYTEFTALNTYQIQKLKAEVKIQIQYNATEHMAMNELMCQMMDMIQEQQRQINELTSLLAQQ